MRRVLPYRLVPIASFALGMGLLAPAAARGQAAPSPASDHSAIIVVGEGAETGTAKLDYIPPEVDGAKITVTKKASVTRLALQPTVVGNNQQQLFARSPGLLVSEQQTPGQFNLSYRGLGNPQESEYVLVLQDGIPISTDWIGFPTLYYTPLPQGLSEIQLIRGGSSLLYGPEPAPAVNFVSKRPHAGEPLQGYSENVGGTAGLFSHYDAIEGSAGRFEFRGAFGHVHSSGERQNSSSALDQGDVYLGFRPSLRTLFYLDAHLYDVSAGDPGRIGYPQFRADPDYSPTPYNHDWVRRASVTLGSDADLGQGWKLEAKLWAAWQTLHNRTAANVSAAGVPPLTTTITDERFRSQGVDLRAVKRWGRGNALTIGAIAYHDDAPYLQLVNGDLTVARDVLAGTARLNQARTSRYQSVFAENVFRLPHRFHVVPSFRLEHEGIEIDESVRPPTLTRPLIQERVGRTVPLFGLGMGFDFGRQNETYFSVSQGYRPLRFFDVASPFSNVGPGHVADPQRSLSWEAGVHGTPIPGLFYDASLFWITFRNRIETVTLNSTDTINLNSGDTRHRGFEGEFSYDLLAPRQRALHLIAFANLSLLDAVFTRSLVPNRVGDAPAFAPHTLVKYGLSLRRDRMFDLALTGVSVASQYWQDSDAAFGAGASFIPAKVPAYTVLDFAGDYHLSPRLRLLAGVSNIADRRYYDRVFQNGIEPAPGRRLYAGLALGA